MFHSFRHRASGRLRGTPRTSVRPILEAVESRLLPGETLLGALFVPTLLSPDNALPALENTAAAPVWRANSGSDLNPTVSRTSDGPADAPLAAAAEPAPRVSLAPPPADPLPIPTSADDALTPPGGPSPSPPIPAAALATAQPSAASPGTASAPAGNPAPPALPPGGAQLGGSRIANGIPTSAPTMTFGPSALDGAGFQNVVAFDPFNQGVAVAGGDVEGFHDTSDAGDFWLTANNGVWNGSQIHVATVAFSQTTPNLVYAGSGVNGAGGGFMASADDGYTWQVLSPVPQFAGGNASGPGLPNQEHPRSTGNLIALDEANGHIYAATFKDGVMRSDDGGYHWIALGLSGEHLRSIAVAPGNPNVVYAATYGDGLWETTTASGAGTFAKLPTVPATVEELGFVGNDLYAAAGAYGVSKTTDGGQTWAALNVGAMGPTTQWESIAGYVAPGGNEVVFAGNVNPAPQGGTGWDRSIVRSTDGGATWTPITLAGNVHFTVGGPTGEVWWLSQTSRNSMLGQPGYVAAQIAIDPFNAQQILVAGRSGVWRSTDGGDNWYPVIHGMNATVGEAVAVDPRQPWRVYVAVEDWTAVASGDGMVSVAGIRPGGSGSVGYALALDPRGSPAPVYLTAGNRDTNTQGELYVNPDPVGGSAWVGEGLGGATGFKRPLAVAVGYQNNVQVLLAAVEAGGVWRKLGTGAWTQVTATALGGAQPTKSASISWVAGPGSVFSSLVYLYDHQTGVYRSADKGATWTKIWTLPPVSMNQKGVGNVAADPSDPTTLYVSTASGLYRLDRADQGTVDGHTIAPINLGVPLPGPIALANGYLYATSRVSQTNAPGLYMSADAGATWQYVADGYYQASAGFPTGIAVDPNGIVYVALGGNGTIVGWPSA